MTEYRIRPATLADAEIIIAQRRGMFHAMGHTDPQKLAAGDRGFEPWVRARLASGEYLGWLAETMEGEVVAGAGLWLIDWLPSVLYEGTRRGYVLNVFTEITHRRRGLARRLMEAIMEYCRTNQINTLVLHASHEGRPLYETLGFIQTNEMRWQAEGQEF